MQEVQGSNPCSSTKENTPPRGVFSLVGYGLEPGWFGYLTRLITATYRMQGYFVNGYTRQYNVIDRRMTNLRG
jgi:hypothetical protein